MLNLVTIERVNRVTTIEGAEHIEVANVVSNDVVIKKGMVKEGDLCLYIRPNTVIPTTLGFNFLEKYTKMIKFGPNQLVAHLIKRIKIKGVESNGVVIPLKHFYRKIRKHVKVNFHQIYLNGHLVHLKEFEAKLGDDFTVFFHALPYKNILASVDGTNRIFTQDGYQTYAYNHFNE